MRFVIPQFIDIEPKIIGPITPRQFILLIFGGGITFLCYKIFSFWVFTLITLFLIIPIFGAFTFVKVNGRPFHYFVLSLVQTKKRPSLRIWQKEYIKEKEFVPKKEKKIIEPIPIKKPLPKSRLSQLALQVDTGGKYQEE
ncbi:MAG: PrgI family mobile element protein [Patescibacteria group bacterium]